MHGLSLQKKRHRVQKTCDIRPSTRTCAAVKDVARVHATAAGRVQCRRHQRLSLQVQLSMDKMVKRRQLQVIHSVDSSTVAIILAHIV